LKRCHGKQRLPPQKYEDRDHLRNLEISRAGKVISPTLPPLTRNTDPAFKGFTMSQADESPTRFIDTPEYRRLVYKFFRMEGERRRGGRLYRLSATQAWRKTRQYVEALQR
jgi:hypothetical protein